MNSIIVYPIVVYPKIGYINKSETEMFFSLLEN